MNYVKFFLFFRNFIDRKNLTKFFILIDVVDCSGKLKSSVSSRLR